MSAQATTTPVEVDTELAVLHVALERLQERRGWQVDTILGIADGRRVYRGRRRGWDITLEDALARLAGKMDERDVRYGRTPRQALEELAAIDREIAENRAEADKLEAVYQEHRWSRFFVVTSSAGHVHCSMFCSTCRPTTTYGWLPHLSGRSEEEAVEELGATLCSVCFPSAPVEWVGGKITRAKAERIAAR